MKFLAGVALVTGLIGMGASGGAWALPEMDVDTLPLIIAPSSTNSLDSAIVVPDDVDTQIAAF